MNAVKNIFLYVVAVFFLILMGYPFIFVLFTSFKTPMEYMMNVWALPKTISIENYIKVLQPYFLRYFLNSIVVSSCTVAIVIFIASMASYAFARMHFRWNKVLFTLFVAGMMIPAHTTLIPIYVLINRLGLFDSLPGLMGPYTSFSLPVAIFIMTGFFKEVPKELEEAALMDGCSHWVIFRKIMFPLSTPAIATTGIYNFLYTWNEFIYALVLINSPSIKTLPLGIREFYGMEAVNIPGVITAILVGSLPVLIFYFLAQERVINGLVSGAVKG